MSPRPHSRPHSRPAFTLVEIVIVMIIIAILTMTMALSFSNTRERTQFDNYETLIVSIIQQARSLSLTNYLVDSEETNYYLLDIQANSVTLTAVSDSNTEEIDSIEIETGYNIDTTFETYYFPPYGDICFSSDCSDTNTEQTFIFASDDETFSTEFLLTIYGGYPEIVD